MRLLEASAAIDEAAGMLLCYPTGMVRWMALGLTLLVLACGGTTVVDGAGGAGGSVGAGGPGGEGAGGAVECEAHDDCGELELCVFATGACALACDPEIPMFCVEDVCSTCGTSSCPACEDCLAVCVPPAP